MPDLETTITRLLDAHQIPYRVLPHSEPVFTIEAAARQRGVDPETMVKSILLVDRGQRYVMACVSGHARLDPKAVRAHLADDWTRLHFADAAEIERVTGTVMGAVAPLCLPPEVPILFDEAIARCAEVSISSGDPMAGLALAADELIRLAGAKLASITK